MDGLDCESWALLSTYHMLKHELATLGEVWLEYKASGQDTYQLDRALDQATRELRKCERKLKKRGVATE